MILTVAALVVAYLYLAVLAWRVGHSGQHGQRVWSPPRPTRLRHQGAHAKPHAPKPEPETAETAGLAVAA